jgi:vacuolar-type H+-ATPase subunit H
MNIDEILDEMDEVLDKSPSMPFAGHKTVVDADRLRELINDVRLNIPQEIKRAKLIDFDCNRIIKEAEAKAEAIVRKAEERAKAIVSNDAIVKEAKQKAIDMLTKAQSSSKEIKNATSTYVNNLLTDAEKYFQSNLQNVKKTKQEISQVKQ